VGAEDLNSKPPVAAEDSLKKLRTKVDLMRSLAGLDYPSRPEIGGELTGRVPRPSALFILGDLTDGHKDAARR
jgi:hypothetical protein